MLQKLRLFRKVPALAAALLVWLILSASSWAGEPRIPYATMDQRVVTHPEVLALFSPGDVVLINNQQDLAVFYLVVYPGQEAPEVDFQAHSVLAVFGFSRPNHWLSLSHLTPAPDQKAVVHLLDFIGGAPLDPESGEWDHVTLQLVIAAEIIAQIEEVVVRYIIGV